MTLLVGNAGTRKLFLRSRAARGTDSWRPIDMGYLSAWGPRGELPRERDATAAND